MDAAPLHSVAATELPSSAEEFLGWMVVERGRAPLTVSAYRRDLRAWIGWLAGEGTDVSTATKDDVERWLHGRIEAGRAPSTVARELAAVRSFHRWTAAEGHHRLDPTHSVEVPKVPAALPKALAEDEVQALLEVVDTSSPAGLRDAAMLEVLYGGGLRISEAVGMSLADIDLDAALLRVFGKGSKERVVPIGSMAFTALVSWVGPSGRALMEPDRWASRDDSRAVFLNVRGGRLSRQGAWGVVKKYGALVGIGSKLSPHVLRHSCATHMLDHGADIRIVQELLGHASITTTQVYTKVSQERLFAVHASAHPRGAGRDG